MNTLSLLLRNRYGLSGVGVAISYVVFAIFQANHFVSTLLRGEQYYYYYLVYVPTLFALFCLYFMRASAFDKIGWSLVFGAVAGYVAGFAAYIILVIAMGNGLARIANSVKDIDGFLILFSAPLVYLSWVYGALSAFIVFVIRKKSGAENTGNGASKSGDVGASGRYHD